MFSFSKKYQEGLCQIVDHAVIKKFQEDCFKKFGFLVKKDLSLINHLRSKAIIRYKKNNVQIIGKIFKVKKRKNIWCSIVIKVQQKNSFFTMQFLLNDPIVEISIIHR